jgi:hypothetical protein
MVRRAPTRTSVLAVIISGIAVLGAATSSIAGSSHPSHRPTVASNAEAGTDPRLTMVGNPSYTAATLTGMSPDGGHLYVQTNQVLNVGDPGSPKLYDIYAGQARIVAFGHFPRFVAASRDGSVLAFQTDAAMTPDDTDDQVDVYIEVGGAVHLVTKNTAGPSSSISALAEDGSAVIFASAEEVAGPDPTPNVNLFRWSLGTDQVTSLTPDTSQSNTFQAATPDLGRVLFASSEDLANTGVNAGPRLFERVSSQYLLRADNTIRDASADMSRVYFSSNQAYVPSDIDGVGDGYVWHSDTDTYELLTPGTATGSDVAQISDDGTHWLVHTSDNLDPADTDGVSDIYLFSTNAPPVLLSGSGDVGPMSAVGNRDLSVVVLSTPLALVPEDTDGSGDLYRLAVDDLDSPILLTGPLPGDAYYRSPIFRVSPDGNRIAYRTSEALVPEDTDDKADIYVWQPTGKVLMTQSTPHNVLDGLFSDDVSRLAFATFDAVLPEDVDGLSDWYVADFDVTPPTPVIGGLAALTGPSVDVTYSSTGGAVRTSCRLDSSAWATCPPTLHLTGLASAWHTAEMQVWDAVGNFGSASRTWEVDATPPTATPPQFTIAIGSRTGTTTVPVKLNWTGSDASGIASTRLEQQVDAGPWSQVAAALTGFSTTRSLAPGHTYRFRVTTRDRAGNVSIPATSAPFDLAAAQESSAAIAYSGTWTYATSSSYMAGHLRHARSSSARATYRFTGRAIYLVTTTAPSRGNVQVWIDGVYRQTLHLYSSGTITRRVMYRTGWSSSGTHRIQLRVLGTSGHPQVDIDAFLVIK